MEVTKVKNLGSAKLPLKRTEGQRTQRGLGDQPISREWGVGGGGCCSERNKTRKRSQRLGQGH